MKKHLPERSLRIIGGKWRSRKITFPDREGIRPTPDRVRETLFNWLAPDIAGARCLELYAGSGVLSMEALSRGASHVTLVERDRETCRQLASNLSTLGADASEFTCIQEIALNWIADARDNFDIVFLDPPFSDTEYLAAIRALVDHDLLGAHSLVYVETPVALVPAELPPGLMLIRQAKAGQVHYCLLATER